MIETEHVTYRDGDTALTGFLALDRNPSPRPGILVVHGGAGVDDHARAALSVLPNGALLCSLATCTVRA